jgi:hypothetical protein
MYYVASSVISCFSFASMFGVGIAAGVVQVEPLALQYMFIRSLPVWIGTLFDKYWSMFYLTARFFIKWEKTGCVMAFYLFDVKKFILFYFIPFPLLFFIPCKVPFRRWLPELVAPVLQSRIILLRLRLRHLILELLFDTQGPPSNRMSLIPMNIWYEHTIFNLRLEIDKYKILNVEHSFAASKD